MNFVKFKYCLLVIDISEILSAMFTLKTSTFFVVLARQNARSDRVCLDLSLVTFFVSMTKKVIIKSTKLKKITYCANHTYKC